MICDLFGVFIDARPRVRERTCFLPRVRKRPSLYRLEENPFMGTGHKKTCL